MSGGLFVNALLRETGRNITAEEAERLQQFHAAAYARMASQVRPLPGAEQLLAHLSQTQVPYAIATSGRPESAGLSLKALNVPPEVPVVHAKGTLLVPSMVLSPGVGEVSTAGVGVPLSV